MAMAAESGAWGIISERTVKSQKKNLPAGALKLFIPTNLSFLTKQFDRRKKYDNGSSQMLIGIINKLSGQSSNVAARFAFYDVRIPESVTTIFVRAMLTAAAAPAISYQLQAAGRAQQAHPDLSFMNLIGDFIPRSISYGEDQGHPERMTIYLSYVELSSPDIPLWVAFDRDKSSDIKVGNKTHSTFQINDNSAVILSSTTSYLLNRNVIQEDGSMVTGSLLDNTLNMKRKHFTSTDGTSGTLTTATVATVSVDSIRDEQLAKFPTDFRDALNNAQQLEFEHVFKTVSDDKPLEQTRQLYRSRKAGRAGRNAMYSIGGNVDFSNYRKFTAKDGSTSLVVQLRRVTWTVVRYLT